MRRALNIGLGLVVAAVFLWLTLRQVDGAALAEAARGTSLGGLALAPLLLALGYLCRTQRWRLMLRAEAPDIGFARCGIAFTASIAVNNLLPLRAGDMLRCFGFSGWLGVRPGVLLASVLVERLLDMVTLILALALALWLIAPDSAALGLALSAGVALGVTGAVAVLLLAFPRLLAPVMRAMVALAQLAGLGPRAEALAAPLMATLDSLAARRMMPALFCWSALVWLFEAATYRAIAAAIPALPQPSGAWLAMPLGTLSTLLPSTPGHVGTFDYFARTAMVAAGNPLAEATGFALIAHVTLWLPTTLIGSLCLAIWALAARPGRAAP